MSLVDKISEFAQCSSGEIVKRSKLFRLGDIDNIAQDPITLPIEWRDTIVHGGNLGLQKASGQSVGYFLSDVQNRDSKVGLEILGETITDTFGTRQSLLSKFYLESNVTDLIGSSLDVSTSITVKKSNIDGNTSGLSIITVDSDGEAVPDTLNLLQLLNKDQRKFSISTNRIFHFSQGDNAISADSDLASYLACWTDNGLLVTGESLDNVLTVSNAANKDILDTTNFNGFITILSPTDSNIQAVAETLNELVKVGSDSGSDFATSNINVFGTTTGTCTYSSASIFWQATRKLITWEVRITNINGSITGNLNIDISGTTMPNGTDDVIAGEPFSVSCNNFPVNFSSMYAKFSDPAVLELVGSTSISNNNDTPFSDLTFVNTNLIITGRHIRIIT